MASFSHCPEGSPKQIYYGGLLICGAIDIVLIILYVILRVRRHQREKKRTREEIRRMHGRRLGTIAETTHSKKQAKFITLESGDIIDEGVDSDTASSTPVRKSGLFSRRFWFKRMEIAVNRLAVYFPIRIEVPQMEPKKGKAVRFPSLMTRSTSVSVGLTDQQQKRSSLVVPPMYPPPPLPTDDEHDDDVDDDDSQAGSIHDTDDDYDDDDDYKRAEAGDISLEILGENAIVAAATIHVGEVTPSTMTTMTTAKKASAMQLQYSLHLNELLNGFHRAQDNRDLSLRFEFEKLSLTLPSGKTILNGVNGRVVPGRVTVIMGPSGAGKSTFMNVLMGKLHRTGGRLMINAREVEMQQYKKVG